MYCNLLDSMTCVNFESAMVHTCPHQIGDVCDKLKYNAPMQAVQEQSLVNKFVASCKADNMSLGHGWAARMMSGTKGWRTAV